MDAGDGETIIRLARVDLDTFGDSQPATGLDKPIPGCLFEPTDSAETQDDSGQVQVNGRVYAALAAVVRAGGLRDRDRLRIRGDVFVVVGEPLVWPDGVVAKVRRTTG